MPQSNKILLSLNSKRWQERPTSCPAPRGLNICAWKKKISRKISAKTDVVKTPTKLKRNIPPSQNMLTIILVMLDYHFVHLFHCCTFQRNNCWSVRHFHKFLGTLVTRTMLHISFHKRFFLILNFLKNQIWKFRHFVFLCCLLFVTLGKYYQIFKK